MATPGSPVQADYAMDPGIVNDARYADSLAQGLQALPVISIVTDMSNLDIYSTPEIGACVRAARIRRAFLSQRRPNRLSDRRRDPYSGRRGALGTYAQTLVPPLLSQ